MNNPNIHEIAELRNLGIKSAQMLSAAGIQTAKQIREAGSVHCYLRVKQQQPRISLNLLWALEGFLLDLDWRDISPNRKQELKTELIQLEKLA